jgi:hypothetical protein
MVLDVNLNEINVILGPDPVSITGLHHPDLLVCKF